VHFETITPKEGEPAVARFAGRYAEFTANSNDERHARDHFSEDPKILAPPPKTPLATWEPWEPVNFNNDAAATGPGQIRTAANQRVPHHAGDEEANRLREAAGREGYRAGFESAREEGLRAGREAAQAEGRQLAVQLAQAISGFEAGVSQLEQTVADDLLALALEIARKVSHQAVAAQPLVILDVIREALTQLPLQHAMIHLNPDDAALVRANAGEHLTRAGHRILEDLHLERGDVVIDAGGAHLDARLATRWQRVIASLNQDTPWLAADEAGQS
jgi:flagellar assembly protein FliH